MIGYLFLHLLLTLIKFVSWNKNNDYSPKSPYYGKCRDGAKL